MSINEYTDIRPHDNYEPGDHIDHTGHKYADKIGEPPRKDRPKRPSIAPVTAPKLSSKEEVSKELRKLADAVTMPFEEFIPLAKLAVEKGNELIERIENVQDIVLPDDISVTLDEGTGKLAKNLIGTDTLDADAIKCLERLANYDTLAAAYKKQDPTLDANRKALKDAFSEKRVSENFPDFGIVLILLILYIIPRFTVVLFFGWLCKFTQKIFGPNNASSKIGKRVFKKLRQLFYRLWNSCANCIIEAIYWAIGYGIEKAINELLGEGGKPIADMISGDKGICVKAQRRRYVYNVCREITLDIEAEVLTIMSGIVPGTLPYDEFTNNRCDPDYEPTETERAIARHILDAAIKEEMGAQTGVVSGEPKEEPSTYISQFTILDRMKGEAQAIVSNADGITKKLYTPDGNRVVDKVDAGILGFFTTMNGVLQRMDKKVTDILTLQFLPVKVRTWLCCIIRLLYLLIPRISLVKTGKVKSLPDLERLNIDDSEFIQDAKIYVKIIDSFLGVIMGSVGINVQITGMLSLSELFQYSLMMSLAEGLSIIITALYVKLKDAMFKPIQGLQNKYPDVALALESCPPFAWFMKTMQCSFENLFSQIFDILARMWAISAKAMGEFDIVVAKTSTMNTISIFRKLLQMILNWDKALVNFCQLNKVASEAEKEKMIEKLTGSIETGLAAPEMRENLDKVIPKVNTIYAKGTHLGPEEADFDDETVNKTNQYSSGNNPLFDEAKESLEELFDEFDELGTISPIEAEKRMGEIVKALPKRGKLTPNEMVVSCGEEYKHVLENRLNEIWDALSVPQEDDAEYEDIIPPEDTIEDIDPDELNI